MTGDIESFLEDIILNDETGQTTLAEILKLQPTHIEVDDDYKDKDMILKEMAELKSRITYLEEKRQQDHLILIQLKKDMDMVKQRQEDDLPPLFIEPVNVNCSF